MILQQLAADADAIMQAGMPPPMYDSILVQWDAQIAADGSSATLVNLGAKGGVRHLIPYNYGRAVDIVPNLLVDTADYALGVLDKNAPKKHQEFLKLLAACADATHDPLVSAVQTFLQNWAKNPALMDVKPDLKPKDRVMFTVGGHKPADSTAVRDFWRELTARECKGKEKPRGRCLISGQDGYVERILPCEISILGETAPLISVNEPAACSYGFEQALNGAVSLEAAERFTKALNALKRGPNTHLNVGDMTYVFWNRRGPDEQTVAVLDQRDPDLVRRLINTPRRPDERVADRIARQLPREFFAAALTGNKTRVVFRDWLALPEWEVQQHLRAWLLGQKIMAPDGGDPEYFSVYKLAAGLYREAKDIRKADAPALISSALRGIAPPRRLVMQAVGRCRTEHRVTHRQAALLKMALTITNEEEATHMAELDASNGDPPYVCGRLLAVLEDIQYQAQGDLNSTIIDRFFSSAVATPGRVLTVLLRNAEKAHLPKIRRKRGLGAYISLKDKIGQLHELLPPTSHPVSLSLEEQSRFLLGYYLQRADTRARITSAKSKRAERDQKDNDKGEDK